MARGRREAAMRGSRRPVGAGLARPHHGGVDPGPIERHVEVVLQLLHQAGASPRQNTMVFFGACAGDPDFASHARNIAHEIAESIEDIVAIGVAQSMVEPLLAELAACRETPDAAIWYGMFWTEGIRPA